MRQFSLFLTNWYGIVLWCGLTGVFAIAAYLRLRGKARPLIVGLRKLTERVSGLAGAEGFASGYQELDELVSGNPVFGHQWREFAETLVLPLSHERRQVIRNTVDAASFFNLASIVEGRINLRYYREVSNYLPGLGILGTFVGLTAGIYLAQGGITSGEPEMQRRALTQLLNGASLAFWTSIVGLIFSLVYSAFEKKLVHRIEVSMDTWCEELDKRLERVTLEQLTGEQLAELRDQTRQLERFNTDLAVAISTALDERLEARFSPLLQKTLETLEGLRTDQQEADETFIRKVAEEFRSVFSGAAGHEMNAMAKTMQELTAHLETAAGAISGAGSHVGREFEEATRTAGENIRSSISELTVTLGNRQRESEDAFQTAIHRMETQVGALTDGLREAASDAGGGLQVAVGNAGAELRAAAKDAGADIQGTAARMRKEIEDATGAMGEASAGMILGMQKSIEGFTSGVNLLATVTRETERSASTSRAAFQELQGTVQKLQEVHAAMGRAAIPLEAAAKSVTGAAARQSELIERMTALESLLENATRSLETAGDGLGDAWDRVHTRFVDIDGALARAFTDISRGVEAHADGVRKFVVELDQSLSRATQLLSGAVEELQEAVEELGTKR